MPIAKTCRGRGTGHSSLLESRVTKSVALANASDAARLQTSDQSSMHAIGSLGSFPPENFSISMYLSKESATRIARPSTQPKRAETIIF
jgi:hypothetical protein